MALRSSNTAYLTVTAAAPLENVGWYARVLSERDHVTMLAEVTRFIGLGFTTEGNAEGGGSLTLDSDDRIWTDPLPAGEATRIKDQEAIWQILEDGIVRAEFLAEDIDEDVIPEGGGPRQNIITGRGTACMLEWAPVLPAGMPTPTSTERKFNAPPMTAWLELLREAQADGYVPWVRPLFTADEDSAGVPWGAVQALSVTAGTNMLELLKRWCEANEYVWRMLPGFKLQVFKESGNHLENQVVFEQYRSQDSHKRAATRRDLANVIYADSGSAGIAIASSVSSQEKWHKRAKWVSAGGSDDATSRSAVANVTLNLSQDQKQSRSITIPPAEPGRKPFEDFNVHDWIMVEVPDDDAQSGASKVVGISVAIDQDGYCGVELTLQSRFESRAIKLQRALERLGESTSGSDATVRIPTENLIPVGKLSELSDVDLTGIQAGDIVQWNGSRFVDVTPNLDLLKDVDTGAIPGTGDVVLQYDRGAGLWKPAVIASGGGGGGSSALTVKAELPPFSLSTSVSTSTDRHKGSRLEVSVDCTITAVSAKVNAVAGRMFRISIWEMNANTIAVAVGSANITTPATVTGATIEATGLSWNLDARKHYAFLVTDTATTAVNLYLTPGAYAWPSAFAYPPPAASVYRSNAATLAPGVVLTTEIGNTYTSGFTAVSR